MQRELTHQQESAIAKLQRLRVGALFMACGTGKTQTAAALVNSIDDADLLMWICPCQTKENLQEELGLCSLKYTPKIIGIESLVSDRIYLDALETVKKSHRSVLICDESLKIKNISAQRTKKLLELSKHAYYKLILNGTPITKNIMDIYCQMEFLSPKILDCSYREYKRRYCVVAQKKVGRQVVSEWIKSEANVDHLMSVIDPYVFSCDLQLSISKQHQTVYYYLDDESYESYYNLKKEMLACMDQYLYDCGHVEILGYLQRMQQAYCIAEEKFELVEKIADEKTIVFCKFIRSKEALEKRFPNLLILTYGKNSIGLNLQQYNKCIFFDKTFDYAFAEQSEYRIFRTGQNEDCHYYHLTGHVKLEEMFDRCISKKESLVQYLKTVGKKVLEEL